jgi:tRNA-Thr(GGU) m(6)t(6)A37 methyltransferase TsaA
MEERRSLELKPIGIIHSPYHSREEAPRQGYGREEICQVEVFKDFEEGLNDIERFSHIILIYWLHRSRGYSLMVTPPEDVKPRGLFATRAPDRPCPLGLSVVELLAREGNILRVKGLDAIDGTPLLDIKPYYSSLDEKASH